MSIAHLAVTAGQNRYLEAKFADRRTHAINGGVVLPWVSCIEDQAVDGPDLNLKLLRRRFLRKHASPRLVEESSAGCALLERAVGVKYFNVFGPNEDHKGDMRSMVNKAYHQIRDTGCVRLFKGHRAEFRDGEQLRDFLYVKDAVAMTLYLASAESAHGLYNLGSGRASTWLELVTPVFEACSLPARIDFIEMPEMLRGKYQYHTCASIEKLRQSGCRQPITPLDGAVTEYVRDYLVPGLGLAQGQAPGGQGSASTIRRA